MTTSASVERRAVTVVCFRIYIKKVWKFPAFRVPTEPTADRRMVRQEQEKSFQSLKNQNLRNQNLEDGGVVRSDMNLSSSTFVYRLHHV